MFHHLHGHSYFSNLIQPDALASPADLVKRAKELGLPSICVTDHGSVTGIPDLVKHAKKAGVKPIVGSELYVTPDPAARPGEGEKRKDYVHMVALAMNWAGLEELFELLSKAHTPEQFYGKPRSSFEQCAATKNLIFLTACGGGVLSRDDHVCWLEFMRDRVGADRIYIEIQPHWDERQREINKRAVIAAAKTGLKLVATQDFHYAKPGENLTHEVLLAIGTKSVWSDPERWKYPVDDLYIKTTQEMVRAFMPHVHEGTLSLEDVAQAIRQTEEIAGRLNFEWKDQPVTLPDMGANPDGQLAAMTIEGLKRLGLMGNGEYLKRAIYELEVIKDAKIGSYFLVLADIIAWCRKSGIMVGPARGSSGGSLVCYAVGITQVDPLRHGLIFERFYRPGRIDLPDIDTDFEDERREEVLDYIRQRWGDEHVAMVCSYTKLKPRGCLKDVARVFEIDHLEVNKVTNGISVKEIQIDDEEAERKHADAVFADPVVVDFFRRYPVVEQHARNLVLWMRGTGQHAAGVVIAGVPLSQRAVVSRRGERAVVNWDKWIIEKFGLMKLDVLGLRTLSILRNASENVLRTRGHKIDYTAIPLDDPKALDLFQRGETTGVFQFESGGMRALLKGLRVDRFSVISDAVSLYRPGPMDLIPQYTASQTGKMPIFYEHPMLEPILSETYGIIVYQEQMMRVFVDLAGFTYTQADNMRKIVGKKLGPDEFMKHEGDFITGAAARGIDPAVAKKIFASMVAFAGYAFNKSHAVAYSMLAFWCAFMKAHYPAEFFAAHLSNSDEEQTILAIEDAGKASLEVMMPDVTWSAAKRFVVLNDRRIQAPLTAIKGVGDKAAELIVGAREGRIDPNGLGTFDTREERGQTLTFDAARTKPDRFVDAKDFLARVYKRIVNAKVQRLLEAAGALPWSMPDEETLFLNRKELLGHVFRENVVLSESDTIIWDAGAQAAVSRVLSNSIALSAETKMRNVIPAMGSKPRLVVVFESPEWKDEKNGQMCNGDGFEVLRRMLKDELGMTMKDLYVTSLYRFRKPPLGFEPFHDRCAELLKGELEVIKPPLILAMGRGPIEFFAGKGAKVKENHAKVCMWEKRQVLMSISPIQVVMEPDKRADFAKLVPVLKGIYGR